MMLSSGYTILDRAGVWRIVWMSATLPRGWFWIALFLLVVLPVVWFYRLRVAEALTRAVHFPVTPRAVGLGAPVLSLVCAVMLLYARPAVPLIEWRFDAQEVFIKSTNGQVAMKWQDVGSVEFDPRATQDPALVLKSKDGREAWLILSWLQPAHQNQVLERIQMATGKRPERRGSDALPLSKS